MFEHGYYHLHFAVEMEAQRSYTSVLRLCSSWQCWTQAQVSLLLYPVLFPVLLSCLQIGKLRPEEVT